MAIIVTQRSLLPVRRDGQIFQGTLISGNISSSTGRGGGFTSPTLPEKKRINFTSDASPSISDYQTLYAATHGLYPTARLIVIDADGNWNEWMQAPKFNIVAGVIDSISWDLGEALTGFIILY